MSLQNAVSVIITLVLILAVIAVILVAAGPVFGVRTNIVLSGSMEPAIGTGSVIISRPVNPEEIRTGDIIVFASRTGSFITTHRVIGIERTPGLQFITKGDANRGQDPSPIPAGQVLGTPVLVIPYLGFVIPFARSPLGMVILIGIPALILIAFEVKERWIRDEK